MNEKLLQEVFEALKKNQPIPLQALIADNDIRIKSFLSLNHLIESHKFNALKEVINKVISHIFWQEINFIDIEPEDISNSSLLLKNMIGQVEPLVYVMLSSDKNKQNLISNYITSKIKSTLVAKFFLINSFADDFNASIKEIKNKYYPNNFIILSSKQIENEAFLDNLYKSISYKDLILLQIQSYSNTLMEKFKKKLKILKENNLLPLVWQELSLTALSGRWSIEFNNSYLIISYQLSKDIKFSYKNNVLFFKQDDKLLFLKYYFPRVNKLFDYLNKKGFKITFACKEENHCILIILFQKG